MLIKKGRGEHVYYTKAADILEQSNRNSYSDFFYFQVEMISVVRLSC